MLKSFLNTIKMVFLDSFLKLYAMGYSYNKKDM